MSQADAPKPPTSPAGTAPAKPLGDKPPAPKSPDWGTLGILFIVLFLLIIVVGNATGFGDSQNQPLPPPNSDETDFNNNIL